MNETIGSNLNAELVTISNPVFNSILTKIEAVTNTINSIYDPVITGRDDIIDSLQQLKDISNNILSNFILVFENEDEILAEVNDKVDEIIEVVNGIKEKIEREIEVENSSLTSDYYNGSELFSLANKTINLTQLVNKYGKEEISSSVQENKFIANPFKDINPNSLLSIHTDEKGEIRHEVKVDNYDVKILGYSSTSYLFSIIGINDKLYYCGDVNELTNLFDVTGSTYNITWNEGCQLKFKGSFSSDTNKPIPTGITRIVPIYNYITDSYQLTSCYITTKNNDLFIFNYNNNNKWTYLNDLIKTNYYGNIVKFNKGRNFTSLFVLLDNKIALCFGLNKQGQLGINSTTVYQPTFIPITYIATDNVYKSIFSPVKEIYAGNYHSFILCEDNSIYSCGYNEQGELGLGDTTVDPVRRFTKVVKPTTMTSPIKDIIVNEYSTYLILDNGELWGCGYNAYAQLGLNNTTKNTVNTFIKVENSFDGFQIENYKISPLPSNNTFNNILFISKKNGLTYTNYLIAAGRGNHGIFNSNTATFPEFMTILHDDPTIMVKDFISIDQGTILLLENNDIYVSGDDTSMFGSGVTSLLNDWRKITPVPWTATKNLGLPLFNYRSEKFRSITNHLVTLKNSTYAIEDNQNIIERLATQKFLYGFSGPTKPLSTNYSKMRTNYTINKYDSNSTEIINNTKEVNSFNYYGFFSEATSNSQIIEFSLLYEQININHYNEKAYNSLRDIEEDENTIIRFYKGVIIIQDLFKNSPIIRAMIYSPDPDTTGVIENESMGPEIDIVIYRGEFYNTNNKRNMDGIYITFDNFHPFRLNWDEYNTGIPPNTTTNISSPSDFLLFDMKDPSYASKGSVYFRFVGNFISISNGISNLIPMDILLPNKKYILYNKLYSPPSSLYIHELPFPVTNEKLLSRIVVKPLKNGIIKMIGLKPAETNIGSTYKELFNRIELDEENYSFYNSEILDHSEILNFKGYDITNFANPDLNKIKMYAENKISDNNEGIYFDINSFITGKTSNNNLGLTINNICSYKGSVYYATTKGLFKEVYDVDNKVRYVDLLYETTGSQLSNFVMVGKVDGQLIAICADYSTIYISKDDFVTRTQQTYPTPTNSFTTAQVNLSDISSLVYYPELEQWGGYISNGSTGYIIILDKYLKAYVKIISIANYIKDFFYCEEGWSWVLVTGSEASYFLNVYATDLSLCYIADKAIASPVSSINSIVYLGGIYTLHNFVVLLFADLTSSGRLWTFYQKLIKPASSTNASQFGSGVSGTSTTMFYISDNDNPDLEKKVNFLHRRLHKDLIKILKERVHSSSTSIYLNENSSNISFDNIMMYIPILTKDSSRSSYGKPNYNYPYAKILRYNEIFSATGMAITTYLNSAMDVVFSGLENRTTNSIDIPTQYKRIQYYDWESGDLIWYYNGYLYTYKNSFELNNTTKYFYDLNKKVLDKLKDEIIRRGTKTIPYKLRAYISNNNDPTTYFNKNLKENNLDLILTEMGVAQKRGEVKFLIFSNGCMWNDNKSYIITVLDNNDIWVYGKNHENIFGLEQSASGELVDNFTRIVKPEGMTGNIIQIECNDELTIVLLDTNELWGVGDYTLFGVTTDIINNIKYKQFLADLSKSGKIKKFSLGDNHFMVLMESGDLWCFGNNTYGQLGLGDNESRYIYNNSTITTDLINCKVDNSLFNGKKVTDVSCGDNDWTIIVVNNNELWSTGYNNHGQLGLNDKVNRNIFTLAFKSTSYNYLEITSILAKHDISKIVVDKKMFFVAGDTTQVIFNVGIMSGQDQTTFVTSMLGNWITGLYYNDNGTIYIIKNFYSSDENLYMLTNDNTFYSAGKNTYGQLALLKNNASISYEEVLRATDIRFNKNVKNIYVADYTIIIETLDGEFWAFGKNNENILKLTTSSADKEISQFVLKYNSNIILLTNNNELWVCGYNGYGQLGLGDTTNRSVFTKVTKPSTMTSNIKDIICGGNHNSLLLENNELWACGQNSNGQLGLGDTTSRKVFTQVTKPSTMTSNVKDIICGGYFSILLLDNNELWACGYNGFGELGLGDNTDRKAFTKVTKPSTMTSNVKDINCGVYYNIILCEDNSLWAAGDNNYGQLGLGDTTNRSVFTKVTKPSGMTSNIKDIICGGYFSILLLDNNELWVCGDNDNGQLGLGDYNNRTTFTKVTKPSTMTSNVKDINCGHYHTVLLTNDNEIWACGYNNFGQLGLGDNTDRKAFTKVTKPSTMTSNIKDIICGANHTILLTNDNEIWACGYNYNSQLGLGDTTNRNIFTKVTKPDGMLNTLGYQEKTNTGGNRLDHLFNFLDYTSVNKVVGSRYIYNNNLKSRTFTNSTYKGLKDSSYTTNELFKATKRIDNDNTTVFGEDLISIIEDNDIPLNNIKVILTILPYKAEYYKYRVKMNNRLNSLNGKNAVSTVEKVDLEKEWGGGRYR
jgi:alpha-tubulin suppressor-like RCC1 family protein